MSAQRLSIGIMGTSGGVLSDDVRERAYRLGHAIAEPGLEILSDQATGFGATYRYSGTMMGLSIDFSESVTKYVPPREKVWRTIGECRLLIIASYEMRVTVEPLSPSSSRLTISIVYELPRPGFWRIVGLMLARSDRRGLEATAMVRA